VDGCATRDRLQAEASTVLQQMIDMTEDLIRAVAAKNSRSLMALDKQLEAAFGGKERAFGALFEHTKEHGC
jgi:hypothetical protein